MNILFLTKSKEFTCRALEYLAGSHRVVGVVCKERGDAHGTPLGAICEAHGIEVLGDGELYQRIEGGTMPRVDLAISNTYGRRIRRPLLEWADGCCVNLHGAILPDYRGLYAYNHGLLNGEREWGATAHYVNERFDEGEVIQIARFPIDPDRVSVAGLERRTQEEAYRLTLQLVERWAREGPPPSTPQGGGGRYYSRGDFEAAKRVSMDDPAELVRRKVHAFWCPPYEGAYIEIGGERFQLLPPEGGEG